MKKIILWGLLVLTPFALVGQAQPEPTGFYGFSFGASQKAIEATFTKKGIPYESRETGGELVIDYKPGPKMAVPQFLDRPLHSLSVHLVSGKCVQIVLVILVPDYDTSFIPSIFSAIRAKYGPPSDAWDSLMAWQIGPTFIDARDNRYDDLKKPLGVRITYTNIPESLPSQDSF